MTMMMIRATSIPPPSTSTNLSSPAAAPSQLPLRPIPGSYGLPLVGPLWDRLNYFWFQGPEKFFKTRAEKHRSTVFRTNMPPSFPFFTGVNPRVVALLDVKSFSHLFDMELVEKKDVLIGDFMPSLDFTGGIRVGVYLDTQEPKHAKVKSFSLDILKRSSDVWVRELITNLDRTCATLEEDLDRNGSVAYIFPLQRCMFNFLVSSLIGVDPTVAAPEIASSGYGILNTWLALQILPTLSIGRFQPLEEIFLHSFTYPFLFVRGGYYKLYDFIRECGKEVLMRGEQQYGLTQDETIHNLLFVLGFNAYGGFSIFLPILLGKIASDATGLQERIRAEVRQACKSVSDLGFGAIREMEFVNSLVYETLRLNPPVPLQYGRARNNFKLSSHDSIYEVERGELLCGYQPLVMQDPQVFDEPEKFKPERFMGERGSQLLNYLYWSNGPQTGTPSESNKQCAAKDFVTLTACMIVAYLFLKYDKITGDSLSIKALVKATE